MYVQLCERERERLKKGDTENVFDTNGHREEEEREERVAVVSDAYSENTKCIHE